MHLGHEVNPLSNGTEACNCNLLLDLPDGAGDGRGSTALLTGHRKCLLQVTVLLRPCVLARRWRVETDAGATILTILAGIDGGATCDTPRSTTNRLTDVPLALLCKPPERC